VIYNQLSTDVDMISVFAEILLLCAGKCRFLTWLNISHNQILSMTFVSQLTKLTGELMLQNSDACWSCPL